MFAGTEFLLFVSLAKTFGYFLDLCTADEPERIEMIKFPLKIELSFLAYFPYFEK
jgi:hypothetical protein